MWEIYAYDNIESLFGIFNAVASMLGAGSYTASLGIVTVCGFFAAMVAYAFAPQRLHGWQWLGTVVLVFSVLLVPKVSVSLVDKTGGSAVRVVDNVPLGLALLAGIPSTVGNTLTDLAETIFQVIPGPGALAADFTYQTNGLMFGSRLVKATGSVSIPDPAVRTDLVNFIHNCTMYDLADGTLNPRDFARSGDVWSMMASPNPARFTPVTGPTGITNATCTEAYAGLSSRLPAQLKLIQDSLAVQLSPTLPAAAAQAAIAGHIEQAYIRTRIAAASATAADLIRQSAMINAINDSSQLTGQRINDPASTILAVGRAQAVAQQNASWMNGAKIAEQALPVVRNVLEALLYAVFPLVVLLLLLSHGRETIRMLKLYALMMVWIQLWPPLYATLNYISTIYAQYDLAAAAVVGGGASALSLQTSSTIYSTAVSAQAIVGYLVMSIPAIALALVKGMDSLGSVAASGTRSLESTVGSATASDAAGNVSMGNVTMDQRTISPVESSAYVSRQQTMAGDWTTRTGAGVGAVSLLRNEGYTSRMVSVRVSQDDVVTASRSAERSRSEAVSAVREHSRALTEAWSHARTHSNALTNSTGSTSSSTEEMGSDSQTLDSIVSNLQKVTGLERSQIAQIGFTAALKGRAWFGFKGEANAGTPRFLPAGVNVGVQGGAQASLEAGASVGKTYNTKFSQAEQQVLSRLTNEQVATFKRFADRITRDESAVRSISVDDREAHETATRLAETASRAERAEASFAERSSRATELRNAYSLGETFTIDLAASPRLLHLQEQVPGWIARYGTNTKALAVLMDAELARDGLPPTRHRSPGDPLPNSVDDLHAQHLEDASKVSATSNAPPTKKNAARPKSPVAPLTTPEQKWEQRTVKVREATSETRERFKGSRPQPGSFERDHRVTTGAGKTLGTKDSLLLDAARQVAEDGANTVQAAEDAVKQAAEPIMRRFRRRGGAKAR